MNKNIFSLVEEFGSRWKLIISFTGKYTFILRLECFMAEYQNIIFKEVAITSILIEQYHNGRSEKLEELIRRMHKEVLSGMRVYIKRKKRSIRDQRTAEISER